MDKSISQEAIGNVPWKLEDLDREAQQTVHYAMVVENILAEPGAAVNVQTSQENNVQRFYVENRWEQQWNNLHHLIDVEDNGSQKSTVKITQMGNSIDDLQVITLERNEVDAFLFILLNWRLKHLQPENITGQAAQDPYLDDQPF